MTWVFFVFTTLCYHPQQSRGSSRHLGSQSSQPKTKQIVKIMYQLDVKQKELNKKERELQEKDFEWVWPFKVHLHVIEQRLFATNFTWWSVNMYIQFLVVIVLKSVMKMWYFKLNVLYARNFTYIHNKYFCMLVCVL